MNFNDFIKSGKVRRTIPNKELSNSLIKASQDDLIFLNKLKITSKSSRKILV